MGVLCYLDFTFQKRYRFDSFAPVRNGEAKWFVDGQDYMSAVADAIMGAKHEIFITDWQMNLHIFMKRPDTGVTSLEWRLDKMLLEKAKEGVRVYILLYWETKDDPFVKMDLGSEHTLSILKGKKNIEVYRHPTFFTPVSNPATLLRWSHHEKVVVVDRSVAFIGGIDLCFGRWDTHAHELTDIYQTHPCVLDETKCMQSDPHDHEEPTRKYSRWVGKDYGNTFIGGGRSNFDEPVKDYLNRKVAPRMPWHDVSCSLSGEPALDAAKHFIQRYIAINSWKFWDLTRLSVENWDHPEIRYAIHEPSASNVKIQVLRSVDEWSAGQPHEDSIHNAYLHAIRNAEHFIYIENQFFISSQPKEYFRQVKNGIQLTLSERIADAYIKGEDFHVIIVLPLQPEFPGEWGTDSGKDLEAVSYWNYATLFSGEDSLMHRLKEIAPGINPKDYITVYGLRTHGILNDELVTEIIYVHSKLMIVDDRLAIIGSANVNDRSMLGSRDSEVDVIIEDKELIDGSMNGKSYRVGKFSHGLRFHLMKEHLGLLNNDQGVDLIVQDPLKYKDYIYKVASSNTNIYDQVFRRKVLPTSSVLNYKQLEKGKSFQGLADILPDEAKEELSKVRGAIVLFPETFLSEVLKPSILDYGYIYVDNRGRQRSTESDGDGTLWC